MFNTYIYIYTDIHIHIYICVNICVYICIYMYLYTCIHICICTQIYVFIHMYVYNYIYIHTCICICIYTYTCKYTYVYLYSYNRHALGSCKSELQPHYISSDAKITTFENVHPHISFECGVCLDLKVWSMCTHVLIHTYIYIHTHMNSSNLHRSCAVCHISSY